MNLNETKSTKEKVYILWNWTWSSWIYLVSRGYHKQQGEVVPAYCFLNQEMQVKPQGWLDAISGITPRMWKNLHFAPLFDLN